MRKILLLISAIFVGFIMNFKNCFAENYYIADTHFGHAKIIELCSRPFENVEEMDTRLIENWNKTVTDEDTVYILGDFAFKNSSKKEVCKILDVLKGEKHLIIGNHDANWLNKMGKEDLEKYFQTTPLHMTVINHNSKTIGLCHYPIVAFPGILIHGHLHNNKNQIDGWDFIKNMPNILNASVEINDYKPVTLQELIVNNNIFKKS